MAGIAEASRWHVVGTIIDQNARDFLSGRFGLVHDLVAWFKAIDLFRAAENETMILKEPTASDRRQHKTWLASLIAEGERLVTEAQAQGGLPSEAVRFRLADVEATLAELYLTQREWHGGMSAERKREILRTIFDGSESSAWSHFARPL